ncbi:glycosyltransferase [Blastococcus sp. SYSU D00820]
MNAARRLPRGETLLMVASTGGHLQQARLLARALEARGDSHWITFANAQSQALLADQSVTYVPYLRPRDWAGALRAVRPLVRAMRARPFGGVVSTGAAIAPAAAIAARLTRTPFYYVESIARTSGPSLSGRILERMPWVHLFTQHEHWAGGKWAHDVSVLDALVSGQRPIVQDDRETIRVFVTLGTIKPYRFDSLVENVKKLLSPRHEVRWQVGATTYADLPGEVALEVSGDTMSEWMRWCDILVTHAGVGTVLQALELGLEPIVVPRRASRGEHVDDHQEQIAELLANKGLARWRESGEIQQSDLTLEDWS